MLKVNHQDNSINHVNGIVVSGHGSVTTAIVQQPTANNTDEIDWEKMQLEINATIQRIQSPLFLSMRQELLEAKQAIAKKDQNKLSGLAKRIGQEGISFITALSANTLGTLLAKLLGG